MIRTNILADVAPGKSVPQSTNDAILFGPDSISETSHVFNVQDKSVTIVGYNLSDEDVLVLEHVGGEGSGLFFQACTVGGTTIVIANSDTFLKIDARGRYRLRHYGPTPVGVFYAELIR